MLKGLALFVGFLEDNHISPAEAGRQLSCTRVAVYKWVDESQRPDQPMRLAIERWTKGKVPADSWLTDEDRAKAADVRPFEAAAAQEPTGTEG